ncbi:MAG: hypothetical protein ACREMJ_08575, partial [Gemmatimonadales bacterium]
MRGAALVPIDAHVAEGLFGEQVGVAVAVQVGEAEPLPDVKCRVPIRAPRVPRPVAGGPLEEHHAPGGVLKEQIVVAVGVDVHELGARRVEPPQERMGVGHAALVPHLERRHVPDP